jgi:hypothetical protein
VAQGEAGATVFHSPEALQTELERRGLNDAWYALTYRLYQVNADSAEITQVRRISEARAHIEEFQDMLASAAGHLPRHVGREFSQVKVGIIPDTLLTANPLNAVSQLVPNVFLPNKRRHDLATAARMSRPLRRGVIRKRSHPAASGSIASHSSQRASSDIPKAAAAESHRLDRRSD